MKKITTYQMIILLTMCNLFYIQNLLLNVTTPPANQDIWLVNILSLLYICIISFPLLYLSSKFSNMTPIEYSKLILGEFWGKVVGFFLLIFYGF